MKLTSIGCVAMLLLIAGCESSKSQVMQAGESQVQLRSMQSRAFDTTDRATMMRTVMATLQDLGFVIDSADEVLGSVSATKLDRYRLRMTVMTRPRGASQLLVRANAEYNQRAVEQPEPYQDFFEALSKSIFLTAHEVD